MLTALAKHHLEDGKFAAAERCLKAALPLAPDESTYRQLAGVYEKQGQEDKWLATLEEFLQRPRGPGEGFDDARVRQTIALHFMERKQWEKAEPYAEEAAKTGAGWAMLLAGACQEGLKNWDAAEEHVRNAATTYSDGRLAWYSFCRRTGHGDVDSARQTATEFIENFDPSNADAFTLMTFREGTPFFYVLEQQFDRALNGYEVEFARQSNPCMGLEAALVADRLKDTKKRDEILQEVKTKGPTYMHQLTGKPRRELLALADLIIEDLAHGGKGAIDLKAADKTSATADDTERMKFNCILAIYLDLHGKQAEAIQYWRRCVACTAAMDNPLRTIAAAELIAHGHKAEIDAVEEALKGKKPKDKK